MATPAVIDGSVWNKNSRDWRELVDTATAAWDFSTPGQAKLNASVTDGAISTAKLANDAVTYAKMQNVSAQYRILGRKTTAAGDVEECTLSEVLDFVTSAADGDILVRTGGAWARLPKATDGNLLTLASGVPAWVAPTSSGKTTIASGSLAAANVGAVITSIPATYSHLILQITGASTDTATRTAWVQVSTDNGANYDTTVANYNGEFVTNAGGFTNFPTNSAPTLTWGLRIAAALTVDITLIIFGYQGGMFPYANGVQKPSSGSPDLTFASYVGSTSAINALRIIIDGTGNFDAGTYTLYGVH